MLQNWELFIKGVRCTVDFLEQERVFDAQRLPSDVVVPVLVALWAIAPSALDAEGRARTLLRKYLWRAFFTNRYEKTTNTRALADYQDLKGLILGTSEREPAVFNAELHPLPELHELVEAGWPVRKDRTARAILALALRHGGADLADGAFATRANLGQREYHHLFADAHLRRQGVPPEKIYRALNCALVTWNTNRTLSDKAPHVYLAQRSEGHPLGDEEVRSRLHTHLIPFEPFMAGNYDDFMLARSEWVERAMRELCGDTATRSLLG